VAEETGRYQLLEDVLEPEMVKQYRIRRGAHCVYMPRFGQEKYLCPCGTINPMDKNCYVCGLEPEPLTREVMEQLSRDAALRMEEEERQRAAQEEKRLAREAALRKKRQAQRLRRIILWAGAAVAAVSLGVLLFWLSTRVWIPAGHYNDALQAMKEQNWQVAHREFILANNSRDAKSYLIHFRTPTLEVESRTVDSANRESYTYDTDGNRLEMKLTDYALFEDGSSEVLKEKTYLNIYEQPDRPLQKEDFYGKKLYTYNDRGHMLTEETYRDDGTAETYRFFSYEYYSDGTIRRRSEICSELISVNYSYEYQEEFTYDDGGRVRTKQAQANYPASPEGNYYALTTYTYDGQGRRVASREEVTNTLDQNGDGVTTEQWVYSGDRLMQYSRRLQHGKDPRLNSVLTVHYTYDEDGRLLCVEKITQYPNDAERDQTETFRAAYDREGRMLWEQTAVSYASSGRFALSGFTRRTEYTYDLLGRLTEKKLVHNAPESASMQSYATREVFSYRASGALSSSVYYEKTPEDRAWVKVEQRQYNENGLPQTVTGGPESRTMVRTYSYAYFYDESIIVDDSTVSSLLHAYVEE